MNRAFKLIAGLMSVALVPLFADKMPVAGSAAGTFTNLSEGSGSGTSTWTYDSGFFGENKPVRSIFRAPPSVALQAP